MRLKFNIFIVVTSFTDITLVTSKRSCCSNKKVFLRHSKICNRQARTVHVPLRYENEDPFDYVDNECDKEPELQDTSPNLPDIVIPSYPCEIFETLVDGSCCDQNDFYQYGNCCRFIPEFKRSQKGTPGIKSPVKTTKATETPAISAKHACPNDYEISVNQVCCPIDRIAIGPKCCAINERAISGHCCLESKISNQNTCCLLGQIVVNGKCCNPSLGFDRIDTCDEISQEPRTPVQNPLVHVKEYECPQTCLSDQLLIIDPKNQNQICCPLNRIANFISPICCPDNTNPINDMCCPKDKVSNGQCCTFNQIKVAHGCCSKRNFELYGECCVLDDPDKNCPQKCKTGATGTDKDETAATNTIGIIIFLFVVFMIVLLCVYADHLPIFLSGLSPANSSRNSSSSYRQTSQRIPHTEFIAGESLVADGDIDDSRLSSHESSNISCSRQDSMSVGYQDNRDFTRKWNDKKNSYDQAINGAGSISVSSSVIQ